MVSYLKGYEVQLKELVTNFTVMYQKSRNKHALTIIYDDFGKEIVRDTEKHDTELEALKSVLARAYSKREEDYISVQKDVYKALNEPVPSEDFIKGEFKGTADAKEILALVGGIQNGD